MVFSFLKSLLADETPVAGKPAENSTATSAHVQAKLTEFRDKLTRLLKQDSSQVLGTAFVIEMSPDPAFEGPAATIQDAARIVEPVLADAAGASGFYRRFAAGLYFIRLDNAFSGSNELACEGLLDAATGALSQKGGTGWRVSLSAALPNAKGDVDFVEVTDLRIYREVLSELGVNPALQSTDALEFVDGDPASPKQDDTPGRSAPNPGPAWKEDDAWHGIKTLAMWKPLERLGVVDAEGQPGTAEPTVAAPAPNHDPDSAPEDEQIVLSAADRVRAAEEKILTRLNDVRVFFRPIWDMNRKTADHICSVPALTRDNLVVAIGDDLFGSGVSVAVTRELDLMLLRTVLDERSLIKNVGALRFLVPIHYQTMMNPAARRMLSDVLRDNPASSGLDLLIVTVPTDVQSRSLQTGLQTVSGLVGEIWLEFQGFKPAIADIDRNSIARIGISLPDKVEDEAVMAAMMPFISDATNRSFKTFVRGVTTRNLAMAMPALGVDAIAGKEGSMNLAPVLEAQDRFDMDRFLA